MRLQSNLGSVQYGGRADLNNGGMLSLARVVKVYEREQTADVVLVGSGYMGDNDETKGQISCFQLERYSGFDETTQSVYGDLTPLVPGQMVVIGYIDALKGKPIILGTLPDIDNALTHAPRMNVGGEVYDEREERMTSTRLQDFSYMNGAGEFEKGSNSRAFFVGKKEKMSDHREDDFRWEDLTPKNKFSYKTIGIDKALYDYSPFNYLMVTKNRYEDDEETTYNRLYHDAEKGITRASQDKEDKLFMMELDENGNFEVSSQRDTPKKHRRLDEPDVYKHRTLRRSDDDVVYPREERIPQTYEDSEKYSKVKISEDGEVTITYREGEEATKVTVGKDGVDIKTTQSLNVRSMKEIYMVAPHIYIHEGDPEITMEDITGDTNG